jgi:hypothetical protein
MEAEVPRLESALKNGEFAMSKFGDVSKGASSEVATLGAETTKLKGAVVDATSMLEELARLITTVERFIDPKPKKDT